MAAFLYRMPNGIPGDVTRQSISTIEGAVLGATAFGAYGLFAKISSGKIIPITTGDVASSVAGLLVRPFPITGANASDALGTSVPPTSGIGNLLKRGYATVALKSGTAAMGGQVYVRVGNASSGKPIGGVEAAAELGAATAAAVAGNTGNGTMGTVTVGAGAKAGVYVLTCIEPGTNAGKFLLQDPDGIAVGVVTVAAAFSAGGLGFTLADGSTDFASGDAFTITVATNTLAVPNCVFTAAADASGNVEIAYNI
jgi:hypothetical protein